MTKKNQRLFRGKLVSAQAMQYILTLKREAPDDFEERLELFLSQLPTRRGAQRRTRGRSQPGHINQLAETRDGITFRIRVAALRQGRGRSPSKGR